MAAFSISEIIKATDGTMVQEGEASHVGGVSTDTRSIAEGDLFIPLIGENFDGHAFLGKAATGGAACVLVSDRNAAAGLPAAVTVIAVKNTLHALEALARFHRLRFSIPVVAVTGSNGKTTTKDMTTAVLRTVFHVCATKKNFNNEIGLSKTLLGLTEKDEVCVVEMGMRGFGQIDELCQIALPTVGVVTNVGTSHIGLLGSRDNIAKAKSELVQNLPSDGTAILNEDDPRVRKMRDLFSGQVLSFGIERKSDVMGSHLEFGTETTDFRCEAEGHDFSVRLHLLGIHNVYDALAAAAVGSLLGVPAEQMKQALESFVPQGASQKLYRLSGALVLDDSYNANPLSVEMAFRALFQLKAKRRILVLGDMLELGDFAEELHYQIGKLAASYKADVLVTVGPLSRMTARGAVDGGMKDVICCDTCEEAASYLRQHAGEGDSVLIKGSHAMHMETIKGLWEGDPE